MCGIAGYAGRSRDHETSTRELRAMCHAIRHRGPDDEGHYVAPGVALGMRRLSIIDVSGGMQPIANEDGTVQVVFNGEIYNHRQLRARLIAAGHRFATHSDTETIVHMYEERGDAVVDELAGMFGFALWDTRRERLLVARDRLGIKPLYYWEHAGGVAFASELRALVNLPGFPRELEPAAVAGYLSLGYVPESTCIFKGVRKLPPGHRFSWTRAEGVRVSRYWTPVRDEVAVEAPEAVEELRRLLAEAVESHLESEVPLGAFLSGGIDSSTVVAQMTRLVGERVRTFSIGFDDPAYNEAPDAAHVARALGTQHTELIVRPDADALVEDVVLGFDEPFADSSALPTFLVARLAREQVTVALSGDGGDELFGGYTRYAEVMRRGELPRAVRPLVRGAARALPHGAPGRNRLLDVARSRQGRYTPTVALPLDPAEGGLGTEALTRSTGDFESLLAPLFAETANRDFLNQMGAVDLQSYLPGDILTKVDRTTMAVSLEARVPLLDHRLAEFAMSLPASLKLRDGTGKWLLREAIRGLVPDRVLTKPKSGFALPLRGWLRRELRHRVDALLRPDAAIYAWVDAGAARRVASEHLSGRRDHSVALWRLLALELWLNGLARGTLARPLAGSPSRVEASRRVVQAS